MSHRRAGDHWDALHGAIAELATLLEQITRPQLALSFAYYILSADLAYLLLLHLQLHLYGLLLVLAALVLEPNAYDTRRQSSHLNQLLLHERIRSRISIVAGSIEGVKRK